jgi:endoglycosylceramidase
VLCACSDDSSRVSTKPLATDGVHLRDADGRVALLRGINARVEGVFDVTFDDGRIPLEEIPALTQADCNRMRQLGFDLLRLPIQWSGIEPDEGSYDDAYLARVDAAIACADAAGMLVVVDLHQDAYSKEIGEDGAPLWAIQPPPTQLLEGPLTDLAERRLSPQVQAAFHTFFDETDASGLQAKFAAMLGHVATRWAESPAVIGFELFNEPDTGTVELAAFHARAASAVRAAAPEKLVMFEPPALRNFTDFIPTPSEPFADPGAVYSPHIYTYVFQPDQRAFQMATMEELEASVRGAREEATAWKTPLWIGEYGVGPDASEPNERWMQAQGVLHARYFASNAFWLWKEQSQGSWGLFDYDAATDGWTERPNVIARVSRLHVARIAGTPSSLETSALGDELRLELESSLDVPHAVYIPERFAANARATCDGASLEITRDTATGIAELSCDGVLAVVAQ